MDEHARPAAASICCFQALDRIEPVKIAVVLDESMARAALERGEVLRVACVGQLVKIDHRLIRTLKPVQYKVATDEAGSAGYEDCH